MLKLSDGADRMAILGSARASRAVSAPSPNHRIPALAELG
jgi:hypothetical protein